MVPCLHQGNIFIQRKLQVWRAQKCIPQVGAETPLTCACRQNIPSRRGRYRAENGNLSKFEWTSRHGTVFAPRQCLYQKKATGIENPEMYSTSRCRNPTYLCRLGNYPISLGVLSCAGRETTPSHGGRYMAVNGNLHKLGWRSEMYSTSRCRTPTNLCMLANYPV